MESSSETEATFEETYPKYPFPVLVRMGVALAKWSVAIRCRASLARREREAEARWTNSGHHAQPGP